MKLRLMLAVITFISIHTSSYANEIVKEAWMNSMSTALPTLFCQADQYFRQCFQITQRECEEIALSSSRVCLKKYEKDIPSVLNQPKDGNHWGSIIGSCAGESFELVLQKKRISNEKCNNPENWK